MDQLRGGVGDDVIYSGERGSDSLFGGYGDDWLVSESGGELTGGPGADKFVISNSDISTRFILDFNPYEGDRIFAHIKSTGEVDIGSDITFPVQIRISPDANSGGYASVMITETLNGPFDQDWIITFEDFSELPI